MDVLISLGLLIGLFLALKAAVMQEIRAPRLELLDVQGASVGDHLLIHVGPC